MVHSLFVLYCFSLDLEIISLITDPLALMESTSAWLNNPGNRSAARLFLKNTRVFPNSYNEQTRSALGVLLKKVRKAREPSSVSMIFAATKERTILGLQARESE
jgi:hypothetical protein